MDLQTIDQQYSQLQSASQQVGLGFGLGDDLMRKIF